MGITDGHHVPQNHDCFPRRKGVLNRSRVEKMLKNASELTQVNDKSSVTQTPHRNRLGVRSNVNGVCQLSSVKVLDRI